MRILVVEDEPKLAKALQEALEAAAHTVTVCLSGEEGFYLIQAQPFDLMILDVTLPGHDGLDILTTLRTRGVSTPVILLTCESDIEERVRGLDAGADDYLVKPFALPELLARIRLLMRRGQHDVPRQFRLKDLEMDVVRRYVARGGQGLDLTAREFELLEYLLANSGRVVSRQMLARDVWKGRSQHIHLDNVIDAQIARLRRKIDERFEPKLLHTVRGVGFVLREEQ